MDAPPSTGRPPPPRFSWPMRLLLGLLLFDICFHSVATLFPYREWANDMGLPQYPKRLPTPAELDELRRQAGGPGEVADRVMDSLDSLWEYCKPWPSKELRSKLTSWEDRGMFALSWTATRLAFLESLVGVSQRWMMFSPNVSKGTSSARARLRYADGHTRDVRLVTDPEDLACYSHWLDQRWINAEMWLLSKPDHDARIGYCNYLAHRYPAGDGSAPLVEIYLYKFEYQYPGPDDDAEAFLRAQNGPPGWDRDGPFFVYEVASRTGRWLTDEERQAARKKLGGA